MKCFICILLGTNNKDISTSSPVQDAVDNAQPAVTMFDGTAYCVEHLHAKVISDIGKMVKL
jgi:hypothetical protein